MGFLIKNALPVTLVFFLGFFMFSGMNSEKDPSVLEIYSGSLIVPQAGSDPISVPFSVVVKKITSEKEISELADMLNQAGPGSLKSSMSRLQAGTLVLGNNSRYQLAIVRHLPTGDGYILRGITSLPVNAPELFVRHRSSPYTFGVVELHLNIRHEGNGLLHPVANVSFSDDRSVVINSTGQQPYRLSGIRKQE